jgi:probable biosynthetic protein (TIGR04098 family)
VGQVFRRDLEPVTIGMPQMGPYGLSENWLLRHLGDVHWQIICEALGRHSRDMVDREQHRLYASFARASWTSTVPLSRYRESEGLTGWIEMVRYGDGMFVSTASLFGAEGGAITTRLASIFTRREGLTNDRLLASAPVIFDDCAIPDAGTTPRFVEEHRLLRGGKSPVHSFMNLRFETDTETEEATNYQINGYQDFNGANLLYFASYPTIADICASRTHYVAEQIGFTEFVTKSSPIGRDIFYFGNANLGDWITCAFQINNTALLGLAARVDLFRTKTSVCIGKQFVVREVP